jgi:comEA protein
MTDFTSAEKRILAVLVAVIAAAGIIQLLRPMIVKSDLFDYSRADSVFQRRSDPGAMDESENGSYRIAPENNSKESSPTTYRRQIKSGGNLPPPAGSVDLNRASAAELEKLPHIGPAMASRIVEFRKTNGRFKSWNDLKKVKGVGAKTLESIKPYLKKIE